MKDAGQTRDWPRKDAEHAKRISRESVLRVLRLFAANRIGSALIACDTGIFIPSASQRIGLNAS
jgi:hypothetical protein